jgi:hypothetical protein
MIHPSKRVIPPDDDITVDFVFHGASIGPLLSNITHAKKSTWAPPARRARFDQVQFSVGQ